MTKQTEVKKIEKEETDETTKKGTEKYYEGIGRRKSAVARVRLYTKKKEITVNGRDYKNYFSILRHQKNIESPFEKMNCPGKFGASVQVAGGGINAQSDAIRLGISRAMIEFNADFKKRLRRAGYLTRDSRKVERKKYGLKKARRAPQWSKR
ncbi:MAG: 30S ribosomal protein S9 [Smithellaceae bacterium]|jgi:small subunit ribosomal protein S9|nr:30S ribosomal protein S9 [Smithellaceae bacterium]